MTGLSTLCYIEKDGKYLMLHRTKKEHDFNKDMWIGVGGHAENGESPEECLLREVKEETGLTLTSYRFRALITFISASLNVFIRQASYYNVFCMMNKSGYLILRGQGSWA